MIAKCVRHSWRLKKEESGFEQFQTAQKSNSITNFLLSPAALKAFVDASSSLDSYVPKFDENVSVLKSTRDFLATVTKEKFGQDMMSICPTP
jgi:hypothetical protein